MRQFSQAKRAQIYLSTLLVYTGFFIIVGMISRIKQPLAEDEGFSPTILGLLDGVLFIGAAAGAVYTAFSPFKKPVLTIFIFSLISALCMSLKIFSGLVPQWKYCIHLLTTLIFGFFYSTVIIGQSVVYHYFDQESDNNSMQIWFGLGALGDPIGILITEFLLTKVGMHWEGAMAVVLIIVTLFSFIMFLLVEQVPIIREEQSQGEDLFNAFRNFISQYYKKKLNIIHTVIFQLVGSLYYFMLLWLPYYFLNLGYQQNAAFISILFPIAFSLGPITIHPVKSLFQNYLGHVFVIWMVIANIAVLAMWFVGDDSSDIPIYIVLVFIISLFISGVCTYISTIDLKNKTNGTREFMMVSSVNRCILRIIQAIGLFSSGLLIESDPKGFLKIVSLFGVLCTLLLVLRLMYYPDSYKKKAGQFQEDNRILQDID